MKKVIIDTNFFLIPYQFKVDIFSEIERVMEEPYELLVLDKSLDELKKIIKEQKGKEVLAAKLGLELANEALMIKTPEGRVDDLIVELADKDTMVCTQDRILKKRLKVKKIIMKQKKYLQIIS